MPDACPDLRSARSLILAHRPRAARDGFPADVREHVVAAASAAIAGGQRPADVAAEVGISAPTLRSWLHRAPTVDFAFRPVVTPENPTQTPSTAIAHRPSALVASTPPAPALTLTSPSGWRVEGLDLDGLLAVLGRVA